MATNPSTGEEAAIATPFPSLERDQVGGVVSL